MIFRRKNKEFNVINFGNGCWGNDIVYDKNITKNICDMHGWYCGKELFFFKNELKKGSLIIKKFQDGYWYGRIIKIEWCNDPKDMFFATVRTITKDKMLSKSEMKYLKDNNLINIKRK